MALVRSIKIDAEVWIVWLERAHHEPRQEAPRAVGHILVVRVDGRIGRCVLENGNVRGAHPLRQGGLRWCDAAESCAISMKVGAGAQATDPRLREKHVAERLAQRAHILKAREVFWVIPRHLHCMTLLCALQVRVEAGDVHAVATRHSHQARLVRLGRVSELQRSTLLIHALVATAHALVMDAFGQSIEVERRRKHVAERSRVAGDRRAKKSACLNMHECAKSLGVIQMLLA